MTTSISLRIWILHGFCKADGKMRSLKIQEKWSICEIIGEKKSFREFKSDESVYISSDLREGRGAFFFQRAILYHNKTDFAIEKFKNIKKYENFSKLF